MYTVILIKFEQTSLSSYADIGTEAIIIFSWRIVATLINHLTLVNIYAEEWHTILTKGVNN